MVPCMYVCVPKGTHMYNITSQHISSALDDWRDLGAYNFRWDDVYATNGTINTSDVRDKININPKKAPVKKHTKEQKYFMSNEKGINTKKKKKTQGTVDTIQEM